MAGLTLAVWLGYVFLVAGEERTIALSLTMMSVSCLVNLDWCLMGLDQFRPIALRNTAVKLLAAGGVFLFVKGKEDLWVYGLIWSLATLVGCLSCAAGLRKRVTPVRVPWKDALRHLRPCAVLFVAVIAVSVYRQMDKVMVGAIAGMEQNGLYESAERIIYCLSGFISAIGSVMMPRAAHLMKQGKTDHVLRSMDTTMQLILCMVCAMAFGVSAVADSFTPLFFGEDFAPAASLMIPLSFTLILIGFANVVRTQWILPGERDRIVVRSVVTGAVLNLIVNALLIPSMGAMGAVVGTLMAEAAVPVVQAIHLRRELPYLRYLRHVATYCCAGGIMLAAVRLAGAWIPLSGWWLLAAQVAVGMAVYGALCLCLWLVTKNKAMLHLLRLC